MKVNEEAAMLMAVSLGVGTVLDVAIEKGFISTDDAEELVLLVKEKLDSAHDDYHKETGTACKHNEMLGQADSAS